MIWLRKYALYFAWLLSLSGFFLSLYVSALLNYEPCPLCWYQRIALFPLAVLLGIAVYRDDRSFALYALVLAAIGEFFALYQIFERYIPALQALPLCRNSGCHEPVFLWFGFFTFPIVSAIGFALIGIFLLIARKRSR